MISLSMLRRLTPDRHLPHPAIFCVSISLRRNVSARMSMRRLIWIDTLRDHNVKFSRGTAVQFICQKQLKIYKMKRRE